MKDLFFTEPTAVSGRKRRFESVFLQGSENGFALEYIPLSEKAMEARRRRLKRDTFDKSLGFASGRASAS
jgi:hypothetical protein